MLFFYKLIEKSAFKRTFLLMGLLFAPIISVFARMFCIIKGLYLYIPVGGINLS